jgi:hypothetical protein
MHSTGTAGISHLKTKEGGNFDEFKLGDEGAA